MRAKTIREAVEGFFNVSKGRARYATIRERILDAAKIDGIHVCQLISAMLIASIGLNVNSTEAVIGAMLICPLMGSVLALAYAVATMDLRVFRRAAWGLAGQCAVCIVTSTLYFAFSPLTVATSELLTNSSATIWDVTIALVGGFAGALGLSRRQEPNTLLAGVAVATALMPPLCAVGYGLAAGDALRAASALYEFLVNVVFIAFGTTVVLMWLKMPLVGDLNGDGVETDEERAEAERESHVLRRHLAIMLVVFAIPCSFFTLRAVQESLTDGGSLFEVADSYGTEEVTRELEVVCPGFVSYRVGVEDSFDTGRQAMSQLVVATLETSAPLSHAQQREMEALVRIHVPDLANMTFEVAE